MEHVRAVAFSGQMRMRESLAQLERAFVDEIEQDRAKAERLRREAERRARQRELAKTHKRGSMRFGLLYLILVATAVLVTVAMFETLYYVMG
jgi:molybdopterin synthase catalytic subunit